jgi:DNA-binding transcriptional LysR family regulator
VVDDLVDRETAFDKLRQGALDLAIVFEHDFEPAAPAEGLVVHPLFDDPLRVVLPLHHRLATHDRVSAARSVSTSFWPVPGSLRHCCTPGTATNRSRPRPSSPPEWASP